MKITKITLLVFALGLLALFSPLPATAATGNIEHEKHFWSINKMQSAQQLLAGKSTSASLSSTVDTGNSALFPNRANGLLFGSFTINGKEQLFVCSASVVTSPSESNLLTAAHCVAEINTGTIIDNLVFVPGYRQQTAPYDIWNVEKFSISNQWLKSIRQGRANEAYDVAFLTVDELNEQTIGETVDSLPIRFNSPRRQFYRAYGYPAMSPFNGQKLLQSGSFLQYSDIAFYPRTLAIKSNFTQGASGGPWLNRRGEIVSLTAYKYFRVPNYIFGPYFGDQVIRLFNSVGGDEPLLLSKQVRKRRLAIVKFIANKSGKIKIYGKGLRTRQRALHGKANIALPLNKSYAKLLHKRKFLLIDAKVIYQPREENTVRKRITLIYRK